MKTKKYKVTVNVELAKNVYVKALNKHEAKFLAYTEVQDILSKGNAVSGQPKSVKVKDVAVIKQEPLKFDLNIFGDDYCT